MMIEILNPQNYGLNSRVVLQKNKKDTIAIIKKRKSRIITKDGDIIIEQAKQIRQKEPNIKIELIISGPICSKTIKLLNDNDISIVVDN